MNRCWIQLLKCYVLCMLGALLLGKEIQAQVYPPYDWVKNRIYLAIDPQYEPLRIYRNLGDGKVHAGPIEYVREGLWTVGHWQMVNIFFDSEEMTFPAPDTAYFVHQYMLDTVEVLLSHGEDSMLIHINHVPYSTFLLKVEFMPGHYQIDLGTTNPACDTTFNHFVISVDWWGKVKTSGKPVIQNLPAGISPLYIDYRYLKPCYEGIFPLEEVIPFSLWYTGMNPTRLAWNITPRKWEKANISRQPIRLPSVIQH